MTNFKTQLETFLQDHLGHDVSFENQEFIECLDCSETFLLPEGSGVRYDDIDETFVFIEVPSGIANGHVTYSIELEMGTVEV